MANESLRLLQQRPKEHSAAVSAACGREGLLATGDDAGSLCLWTPSSGTLSTKDVPELRRTVKFDSQGSPVSGICLWRNLLMAAYGSGHLRIYDTSAGYLKVEVTAHAKWITALDLAPSAGLVVSSSEDSYFKVWKLNADDTEAPTVSLSMSERIADSYLSGAVFMDANGCRLAVAAADTCDLHLFKSVSA